MYGQGPYGSVPYAGTPAVHYTPAVGLTATFSGVYVQYPPAGGLVATFTSLGAQGAVVVTSVSAPTLTAEATSDPLTGAPQITLTVTNTQPDAASWSPPAAMVLRSDGSYVIGASPSDPLSFSDGTTQVIVDRTAPYGIPIAYIAFTSYLGMNSPASNVARAVMGQAPNTTTLYSRLGWPADQDTSGELLVWLSAIGEMIQAVDALCAGQSDTEGNAAPPWSQLLDIDRCPTAALPWLAQFVGVRLNTNARDDQQRWAITHPQGFARGTVTAIVAAANAYLLHGYSASVIERDTGPYHLTVEIPEAAIVGAANCRALALEYATCADLADSGLTCRQLWQNASEVEAAVKAAVPAGLVAAVSFVD